MSLDRASIPDKMKRKATITNILRDQIFDAANLKENSTYLEIGCDICLTVVSVKDRFSRLTGIDIDPERIEGSKETLDQYCSVEDKQKINLILGTSEDIPASEYDVVLIDASHRYEHVKQDFKNVLKKNTAKTFKVFFHDYGLFGSGVKKFINETFVSEQVEFCGMKENWNPHGSPVNDWEAVCVVVKSDS